VPRQFRSLEDKLGIIDEARLPGASVASVARRHGVNANLVFAWMRLQDQGLFAARTRGSTPALLAVTVEPAAPTSAVTVEPAPQASPAADHIEVLLPDGTRVRAFGAGSSEGLERVLRLLRR
jgi:transposase